MLERKPIVADASYTMLLRNDAALLHAYCVRAGRAIGPDHYYIYAEACLTIGCLASWKAILHDGDQAARKIIGAQPAIRLSRILTKISENQFSTSCIQARAGVITILDWVEGGCTGASPFDIRRDPVWPVPEPLKEQLIELRKMRFGWVVCPESGEDTQQRPDAPYSTDHATGWITLTFPAMPETNEYPEVFVNEEQLDRYRQNIAWSDVMQGELHG